MSVIAKEKSSPVSLESSAQLFGQLGKMLANPDITRQTQTLRAALGKSIQQLQDQISGAEMAVLRQVLRELANQVDRLVPCNDGPVPPTIADTDARERALAEDAAGKSVVSF